MSYFDLRSNPTNRGRDAWACSPEHEKSLCSLDQFEEWHKKLGDYL